MNSDSEISKSKSEEEEKEDFNEEEEQEEIEYYQSNEVKKKNKHINMNEFDSNNFIISLQLIKEFDDSHQGDSEAIITDFLKNVGLPMHFKDEETLSLYLYFHKMCIPFYDLLKNIKNNELSEIILNSLKESYYLFADNESRHFNYIDMAKNSFPNLRISQEDTSISNIPVVLKKEISKNSSDLQIKKLILNLLFI